MNVTENDSWRRGCRRGECVAFAADGEDELGRVGWIAQFVAQMRDVHVDGAGFDPFRVEPPDTAQDLLAGNGASRIGSQVAEQFHLARGKFDAGAIVETDLGPAQIGVAIGQENPFDLVRTFGRTA